MVGKETASKKKKWPQGGKKNHLIVGRIKDKVRKCFEADITKSEGTEEWISSQREQH